MREQKQRSGEEGEAAPLQAPPILRAVAGDGEEPGDLNTTELNALDLPKVAAERYCETGKWKQEDPIEDQSLFLRVLRPPGSTPPRGIPMENPLQYARHASGRAC